MLVSLDWLREYVPLPASREELTERLTLTGLNHEGTQQVGDDWVVDLEVTSNRPDCLGHIGVAREIAVVFGGQLSIPPAQPPVSDQTTVGEESPRVAIECPDLCPRYVARLLRGIRVGPSPPWLAARLQALGIAVINNVVDVTNYVMMECGQPLHAFDFAKLENGRIVVRAAHPGEVFTAINHKNYELSPDMCVISDASTAVALGGVMGGAETEVGESTVDVLIEAADFAPLAVRNAARRLNLHSPSSYRFERGVDPCGIDWASRRCCELILQTAGGALVESVADVGQRPEQRSPIAFRLNQVPRITGVSVTADRVQEILSSLGNEIESVQQHRLAVTPPSWRADLTREIDLVEEVARVHGYDRIPEDVSVAMVPSSERHEDVVMATIRRVLLANGFDEAMTISAVQPDWVEKFRPWSQAAPLEARTPVIRGANCLRQSLIPSLLSARRFNESLANPEIQLFETANVYLPKADGLPDEVQMLACTSGGTFLDAKGIVEAILSALVPEAELTLSPATLDLLSSSRSARLELDGDLLGFVGELADDGKQLFELRGPASIVEIRLPLLMDKAVTVRTAHPLSPFPPISRDLNLVVPEAVRWHDVARIVRQEADALLELIDFQEEWRDAERLGADKKSLLFSIQLRAADTTLTNQEADTVRERIVARLEQELGGTLRS